MGRGVVLVLFLAGCDCAAPRAPVPAGDDDDGTDTVDPCVDSPGSTGCPCDRGAPPDKCFEGPPEAAGVGLCARGIRRCTADGWSECVGQILPEDERCNGMDDDCNGRVDDACGACDGPCEDRIDEGIGDARAPRISVDGAGVATVAWARGGAVFVRRDDDGTWGDVEIVGVGREPRVAGNEAGEVFVAWVREAVGVEDAVASRRFTGQAWEGPTEIPSDLGDERPASIAVDGSGRAHAAWFSSSDRAWTSHYEPLGAWFSAEIEDAPDPPGGAIAVAANERGDAVAAWSTGNTLHFWLPSEMSSDASAVVAADRVTEIQALALGIDAGGTAVAAWVDLVDRAYDLYASSREPGADWREPVVIARGEAETRFALSVSRTGRAFLVWTNAGQVLATVIEPVGGASEVVVLDQGERTAGVGVAADADGFALASWAIADGAASRIRAARYVGVWDETMDVSTQERWDAEGPEVACAPDGTTVVVWEQRLGDAHGIHAMRLAR